jgi:para-nitrobenzyl esterase
VDTTTGRLRGVNVGGVSCFRGVRYGQSTAGANRFMPPIAARPAAGILDAAEWGRSAPQRVARDYQTPFYAWYSAIRDVSEDCLFLNVFTPAPDDGRRPVMVWLHGGGWRNFASTAPGTDGSALAEAEDVVVVSLNHRLGAFGFLALDRDDERFADAGNAGLLDIVLALQWVRDNIEAFGGDPSNVTIFGQSGGAAKVAALMAMPTAKGLFHKAIVQSMSGGLRIASREEGHSYAVDLAHALGLERLDGAALQLLPLEAMLAGLDKCTHYFRPVIDDRTFAGDPFYPAAPSISDTIPLMVGCTDTETTYYLRRDPANVSMDMADARARLSRFLKTDAAATDRIVSAYRDTHPEARPVDTLVAVTTDYLFKRNTYRLAALRDQAAAQSFAYVFSCRMLVEDDTLGAPHTCELPFIFGTSETAQALVGTGSHIAPMTRIMMATWAQFARHGDPNNALVPTWRPYVDADRPVMALQEQSTLTSDPGGQARSALDGLPYYEYSNSRDAFWAR